MKYFLVGNVHICNVRNNIMRNILETYNLTLEQ